MIKIGITGGIGSGKSIVSELIRIKGIPCYNADIQSKILLETNESVQFQLKQLLGEDIYKNGKLDRSLMASKIFKDSRLLSEVNRIIHPAVFKDFEQWSSLRKTSVIALESAILFESAIDAKVDFIVSVMAPLDLRIERVMQRDHITRESVRDRIRNQMPEEEKGKRSDFILVNDGKQAIIPQLNKILAEIGVNGEGRVEKKNL
jgi:dephospho-CoA kinase